MAYERPQSPLRTMILAVLAIGGATWTLSALWDHDETLRRAEAQTQDAARLLAAHAMRTLDSADAVLGRLVDRIEIAGLDHFARSEEEWRAVRDMARDLPYIGSLWVVGADGSVRLGSLRFPTPSADVSDRPYFKAHRDDGVGFYIGPALRGRTSGLVQFTISRRLVDAWGRFQGVAMAAIQTSYFTDLSRAINPEQRSLLAIVRLDGSVLVHEPGDPDQVVGLNITADPVFQAYLPKAPEGTAVVTSSLDGVKRIVSYRQLEGLPLVVIAGVDYDHALQSFWRRFHRNLGFATAALAIFSGLVLLIRRGARREEAALQALHAANESLERQVAERTRDLSEALADREVLFREVHHRVKNNLQVVSSLLHMQAMRFPDSEIQRIFSESLDRVHSMGLVHEILYRTDEAARVDFAHYLIALCDNLARSHGAEARGVSIEVRAQGGAIDLDDAVPLALIVNEAVSNALKHAFPPGRGGTVEVEFARQGGGYALTVRDDGIGVPDGVLAGTREGIGLQIVESLAEQVRASVTFERREGTVFTLAPQEES